MLWGFLSKAMNQQDYWIFHSSLFTVHFRKALFNFYFLIFNCAYAQRLLFTFVRRFSLSYDSGSLSGLKILILNSGGAQIRRHISNVVLVTARHLDFSFFTFNFSLS